MLICNIELLITDNTMRRYSPPHRSPPRRGYGGSPAHRSPPRRGYGGSPPHRSPPRRGYGGRGRSPPRRGGYGGRKEQGSGSLLVRNIPLSARCIGFDMDATCDLSSFSSLNKQYFILQFLDLFNVVISTLAERRISVFLLKGLVLLGMFTFQRIITAGKF